MRYVDGEIPSPSPTQVLIKVAVAGVNFIDIYQRKGLSGYNMTFPYTPGLDGAGIIEELGSEVKDFKKGQRVVWVSALGSYAEYTSVAADKLVLIPDGIDIETSGAVVLQGITAHYLSHSTYPIKPGDVALIHAAAGGTGRLLAQMVRHLGGEVLATTSSDAKVQAIKEVGVKHVIRYDKEDFLAQVKEITGGKGVDVVYDGVGAKTFDQSLQCLKPRGMMVLFGAASGAVPPFELQRLNTSGSLFITRPTVANYIATKEEYRQRCESIFAMIAENKLDVRIGKRYALMDAPQSHDDLFSGQTTGKLLLIP